MGLAKNIAIFSVGLSTLTFVAFFGRLPAFRKLDLLLSNGRITNGSARLAHYLMYDKHPVVVVFFLGLISACSAMFIPVVWAHLALRHRLLLPILLPLPYVFTYLSATRNSESYINKQNHASQMRHYPYDRMLYYPGNTCSTCKFLKPARSKHCSICKTCVARMDHHCIWVNNCLGRGNYRWFLALLLSTAALLAYSAYLAYIFTSPRAHRHYFRYESVYKYKFGPSADPMAWSTYLDMKLHYLLMYTSIYLEVGGLRASGVGLLCLLTWPLPLALLAYHVYLIWAGMTTNESGKWADWRDDMLDGVVFLGNRREDTKHSHGKTQAEPHSLPSSTETLDNASASNTVSPEEEPPTTWPLESRHILIRTLNGEPPQNLPSRISSVADEASFERVWDLGAVENAYDLGFWDNFKEASK